MLSVFTRKVLGDALPKQVLSRPFSSSPLNLSRWTDLVNQTKESLQVVEVTAPELNDELKGGKQPILIDVRESVEWNQTGKLPGAVCLPRGVLELSIENVIQPEADKEIVLYCAGGLRSIMAAESLVRMGYKKDNIKSLKGGFAAWRKGGYNVEDAN